MTACMGEGRYGVPRVLCRNVSGSRGNMSARNDPATDPLRWSLLRALDGESTGAALLGYSGIRSSEGLRHACSLGCCLLDCCSRDPEGKLWESLQEAGQLMRGYGHDAALTVGIHFYIYAISPRDCGAESSSLAWSAD
jgi:hypothetical protein